MRITTLFHLLLTLLISGCVTTQVAQNPTEYRNEVVKSQGARAKHESYQVNRALTSITSTLQRKSEECLNYSFVREFTYKMGTTTGGNKSFITYKPTVVSSNNKTELFVQMDITGDVTLTYNPPKNGIYVLAADLTMVSSKKTQANLYYHPYKAAILPATIKKWINGETEGCPDLKEDVASGR